MPKGGKKTKNFPDSERDPILRLGELSGITQHYEEHLRQKRETKKAYQFVRFELFVQTKKHSSPGIDVQFGGAYNWPNSSIGLEVSLGHFKSVFSLLPDGMSGLDQQNFTVRAPNYVAFELNGIPLSMFKRFAKHIYEDQDSLMSDLKEFPPKETEAPYSLDLGVEINPNSTHSTREIQFHIYPEKITLPEHSLECELSGNNLYARKQISLFSRGAFGITIRGISFQLMQSLVTDLNNAEQVMYNEIEQLERPY